MTTRDRVWAEFKTGRLVPGRLSWTRTSTMTDAKPATPISAASWSKSGSGARRLWLTGCVLSAVLLVQLTSNVCMKVLVESRR